MFCRMLDANFCFIFNYKFWLILFFLLDAHFCITFLLKFAHCIALEDAQMHSFAFLFTTKFMNIPHGF